MLAVFRAFAKSWVAKILLGLLVIAFGFWGIQGALTPKISTAVVTAGQRQISETEFRQMVDQQLNQIRQETGQSPNMDVLVKAGMPQQLANELAQQSSLYAWLENAGIKPDKSLAMEAIKEIPGLASAFNPVTGAFDQKMFQTILAQNKINEANFIRDLRDDLAKRDLALGVQAGAQAPHFYTAMAALFQMQTRDASFFILNRAALGPLPQPTEADLQKLYHDLGDRLKRSETRALTLVIFDPRKVADTVTVDPAEAQKVFNFRKDSLSTPEKRTFVQITAKDGAGAAKIAQALKAGQSPDAAAKAGGGQVSTQTDLAKSGVPDPKVGQAVFALAPGQASDAINGDLGWSVVKLASVTPGRAATFEEKRAEIEADLRKRAAQDKVSDMLQKYSEARDAGASPSDAAAKVGATVADLPALTAEGQSYTGEQPKMSPQALQRILSTGFSLPKGGQSEPQNLGGGVYVAVAVKDVRPAYTPKIDELRGDLATAWTNQTAAKRLKDKGDEMLARLRKGEPIAQVAASVHAQVQNVNDLHRTRPQQGDPRAMITGVIFNAPKGEPFAVPVTQTDVIIGQVSAVHPPATVTAAEAVAGPARTAVTRSIVNDLLQGVQTAARDQIKPKVSTANLNASLGLNAQGGAAQPGDQGAPLQ